MKILEENGRNHTRAIQWKGTEIHLSRQKNSFDIFYCHKSDSIVCILYYVCEYTFNAFISSRLDCYNALLVRILGSSPQNLLQHIQKSAARVLTRIQSYHAGPEIPPLATHSTENPVQSSFSPVHTWNFPYLSMRAPQLTHLPP